MRDPEAARRRRAATEDLWGAVATALNLLSPDVSYDARVASADDLEAMLDDGARESVESILAARPLAACLDLAGALRVASGPRTRALLEELDALQPSVAALVAAWGRVPEAFFAGADRGELTATLARGGWFLRLARAHAGLPVEVRPGPASESMPPARP